jgi:hypothetical protein
LINGHTFEILSRQDIYNKTKNNKSIPLIAIRPAKWDNGRLVIHVIDYGVSRKGKHFYYSNAGGSSFQVICGPDENKPELKIINQGGI